MKLDIFTWIPASSAGMTILLFAAQLNAAGVCIVCPPGYNCPTGGAPVLEGVPGQILIRSATGGARWVSIGHLMRGVYGLVGYTSGNVYGMTGVLHHCTLQRLAGNAPVQWSCTNSGMAQPTAPSLTTGSNCWCRFGDAVETGTISCGNSSWDFDSNNFFPLGHNGSCANVCPMNCRNSAVWRSRVA